MGAWEETVRGVMLGTERQPAVTLSAPGALGEILDRVPVSDPERALLDALAIQTIHGHCGRTPPVSPPSLPEPAGPETTPGVFDHLELRTSDRPGTIIDAWQTRVDPSFVDACGLWVEGDWLEPEDDSGSQWRLL